MPDAETDEITSATLATIERFNAAFNRHDVAEVMSYMTENCVFESTWPAPDGTRYEGQAAVRAFWEQLFSSPAQFEFEDIFATGERAVVRWIYNWVDQTGQPGHVRGVDIFRVSNGKVAEKLSYVKG